MQRTGFYLASVFIGPPQPSPRLRGEGQGEESSAGGFRLEKGSTPESGTREACDFSVTPMLSA